MFSDSSRTVHREFQRGGDFNQTRRDRLDLNLSLRKKTRQEQLQKKRRALMSKRCQPRCNEFSQSNGFAQTQNLHQPRAELNHLQHYAQLARSTTSIDDSIRGVSMIRELLSAERNPPIALVMQTGIVPRLIECLNLCDAASSHSQRRNNYPKDGFLTDFEGSDFYIGDEDDNMTPLDTLQFEAAWALTNIVSSDGDFTHKTVGMGALDAFVRLMQTSKCKKVIGQCLWALANIAGEGVVYQTAMLQNGFFRHLVDCFYSFDCVNTSQASWLMSNICNIRRNNVCDHNYRKEQLLQDTIAMVDLLEDLCSGDKYHYVDCEKLKIDMNDPSSGQKVHEASINSGFAGKIALPVETIGNMLWAASHLSGYEWDDETFLSHIVDNTNLVPSLVSLILEQSRKFHRAMSQKHNHNNNIEFARKCIPYHQFCSPAMRLLGNLTASSSDLHTSALLDAGYLEIAATFLNFPNRSVQQEVMWALSNILAGTRDQILVVAQNDALMQTIVDKSIFARLAVRKEAMYCISNGLELGGNEVTFKWIQRGAIPAVIKFLECVSGAPGDGNQRVSNSSTDRNILVGLEGLSAILKAQESLATDELIDRVESEGGLDILEYIQSNTSLSEEIFEKAGQLVKQYWGQDDLLDGADGNDTGFKFDASMFQPSKLAGTNTFGFSAQRVMQQVSQANCGCLYQF